MRVDFIVWPMPDPVVAFTCLFFFFQAEDGIRDSSVTGVQTCALPVPYIALHKPPGVLSSSQSQGGHPTVIELVGSERRLYPVGRLDLESEGLMLPTNDGELAYRLTHPRFEHEKEYRVRLDRRPTPDELRRWREGMALADGPLALPCRVDLEPPNG